MSDAIPAAAARKSWWDLDRHSSPLVILLIALLGAYGQTAIGILPVMVSSWVERLGFSESAAGYIGSATLAGMTLGLAASVVMLKHRSYAFVAALGVSIALVCDLLSIWQMTASVLGFFRLVAGLGYGLVIASVVSWFARQEHADRCFGTFMLLQILVFAPLLAVVPILEASTGAKAPYICLLLLGLISLLILPL